MTLLKVWHCLKVMMKVTQICPLDLQSFRARSSSYLPLQSINLLYWFILTAHAVRKN